MASGDTLFTLVPQSSAPPGANAATPDNVEDGSTPPLLIQVLDFDGATDEHADWKLTIGMVYHSH